MRKEGYEFAAAPLVLAVVSLVIALYAVAFVFFILAAFVVYFFRDPERTPPSEAGLIVSPADGRIMEIVDEPHGENPGRRISIFLSIFDVHVNRAPYDGRIASVKYRRGKFYAAMRQRASVENEQNEIQVTTGNGQVVFKQIAGWVARRIVFWKSAGDFVTRGERVGMIRFGSRVDLWLPHNAEILVRPGEHVAGGSSAVARWR